ncbi:hypothetical protein ACVPPR_07700 [Dellaglioa sp. L3N]
MLILYLEESQVIIQIVKLRYLIRGACWSAKYSTAKELVDKVFKGIHFKSKSFIHVQNHYISSSIDNTYDALIDHYISETTTTSIIKDDKQFGHAKEILIKCDGESIFYMVGSSNFSKNTYIMRDRGVNQTDMAFIKNTKCTGKLLGTIFTNNDGNRLMIEDFKSNENFSGEESSESEYIRAQLNESVIFPYIGPENLFPSDE